MPRTPNRLTAFLIRESTVLWVILLNTIVLIADAFPGHEASTHRILFAIDYACMLFFVLEAGLKIQADGFRTYWAVAWNKLDFLIVAVGLPLLARPFVSADLEVFSVLLLLRTLRFLRVMRFIPNADDIWSGVVRALKASVGVFLVLFVLNLLLAMGAVLLFGEAAPRYFGDPLIAFYSMFKVFTVEGWYEIPRIMAEAGQPTGLVWLLRGYFVTAVLVGGILGLSLANAIFVDEMTMDNTEPLEAQIHALQETLAQEQAATRQALAEIQRLLTERR